MFSFFITMCGASEGKNLKAVSSDHRRLWSFYRQICFMQDSWWSLVSPCVATKTGILVPCLLQFWVMLYPNKTNEKISLDSPNFELCMQINTAAIGMWIFLRIPRNTLFLCLNWKITSPLFDEVKVPGDHANCGLNRRFRLKSDKIGISKNGNSGMLTEFWGKDRPSLGNCKNAKTC